MSTAQILASQMLPVGRGVRAFFAPVDRVNVVPTIFDPSTRVQFRPGHSAVSHGSIWAGSIIFSGRRKRR